jgi:hypothetical protein
VHSWMMHQFAAERSRYNYKRVDRHQEMRT